MAAITTATPSPLHTFKYKRRLIFNRIFALLYTFSLLSLFYHHIQNLLFFFPKSPPFFISISILIADLILTFMWFTTQSFRICPSIRQVFPENLQNFLENKNFPAIDIFICTADPYKEPPIGVVNTALSVMAYDYPTDKISVYVSDDGGSEITLFGLMEAAKFARIWLPFCRKNNVVDRCPHVYFRSNYCSNGEIEKIKVMYEKMRMRIDSVLEKGKVIEEYITNEEERQAFSKWAQLGFTPQQHPSVIQVLLEKGKDKDIEGHSMPNLLYVSREKNRASSHHFKAGALNALLRVSAIMTNAPIILTQDCDMFSNDPLTPQRMLCLLQQDPSILSKLGYIQFPQRFGGTNKGDIYASEFKKLYIIDPMGMDGLKGGGPYYVGSGCFFMRRVFFGGPSNFLQPEIAELSPYFAVNKSVKCEDVLELAHQVAACNFEEQSNWGSKLGFRYGSLSEDLHTGYLLQCDGWQSIFCHPQRPAFLADVPITLNAVLIQNTRWSVGQLEVGFSKHSPMTFGIKKIGLLMALCNSHYSFWPIWFIPITIYSCIPQLALLNNISIFPKVGDPWLFLYVFLFLGAYGQDCADFILENGTFERWWNDQRMWLIRGLSSYMFGSIEFFIKRLGISQKGFTVTSKLLDDDEQSKRYDQGVFEFGDSSPMFITISVAAIVNLLAFIFGFLEILRSGNWDEIFLQMFISGFGVLNSLPIYEAVFFRADKGRMPTKTTFISSFLAGGLYAASSSLLKI